MAQKHGDLITQARVLNNLGGISTRLGKYEESQALQEEALAIARRSKVHNLTRDILSSLGGASISGAITKKPTNISANVWSLLINSVYL